MDDIKYSTHSHSVNKYDPKKDYGTPKSAAEKSVTLDIDGVTISVPEGSQALQMVQCKQGWGSPVESKLRLDYAARE